MSKKLISVKIMCVLQKSIALLLAIGLHGVICAPDISLVSAKNFQGYDYPKPNIPFEEPTRPPVIV